MSKSTNNVLAFDFGGGSGRAILGYLEDGKIIGELALPPYKAEDEKSRETQVNAWLSSMQW